MSIARGWNMNIWICYTTCC